MSTDKEKKLKNNKIDIENENISGGCHINHMGHKHGGHHGPGKNQNGGYWVWVPGGQGMMPPPPPNLDKPHPVTPTSEPNSVPPLNPDSNSSTNSSSPAQ